MIKDFIATISEKSERYANWLEVFGSTTAHIKTPYPTEVLLPGGPALIYHLDLEVLSPEQRARLINNLARRFDLSEEEVAKDLDSIGCPIRMEDVMVTVYHPQRWM